MSLIYIIIITIINKFIISNFKFIKYSYNILQYFLLKKKSYIKISKNNI